MCDTIKFKIMFSGFALPYAQACFVEAPNAVAAAAMVRREARGCEIVSVEETSEREVFARCNEDGERI